jgi:hypothetical protein
MEVRTQHTAIESQFWNGFSVPDEEVEKMYKYIKKAVTILPEDILPKIKEKSKNVTCWTLTLKARFFGKCDNDGMCSIEILPYRIHRELDDTLYVQDIFTSEWFCLKPEEEMDKYVLLFEKFKHSANTLGIGMARDVLIDILNDEDPKEEE